MKKQISAFIILATIILPSAYSEEVDVKTGMAAIEVYYQNTQSNKEIFHDVGVSASAHLHDRCAKEIDCNSIRTRPDFDNTKYYEPINYSRWGVLRVDAMKRISGSDVNFLLNETSVSVFEGEDKDGFRFHFLKVGYKKENRVKYLDYRIPVELIGVGHEVVFNVATKYGRPIVQLFIKGDVAISAGYAKTKDLQKKEEKDGQTEFVKREADHMDFAASYNASSGIRILNQFELAGIGGGSTRTTMSDLTYGGKATYNIKYVGSKYIQQLQFSAYLQKGTVNSNTLYGDSYSNGTLVQDQNFVQGGVGIGFKF